MKKILLAITFMIGHQAFSEDILMKSPKKESSTKIKQQLARDLDELMQLSTLSIRELSGLIDDMVVAVKQLMGEQEGVLATSDKKVLQSYQQKVNELKQMLAGIPQKCTLQTC